MRAEEDGAFSCNGGVVVEGSQHDCETLCGGVKPKPEHLTAATGVCSYRSSDLLSFFLFRNPDFRLIFSPPPSPSHSISRTAKSIFSSLKIRLGPMPPSR